MRFRDVSNNVKEVQKSLERTSKAYSTSTTAGNGVGDLMRQWAYILEQCAKALDNKEAKILLSGEAPVQQTQPAISLAIEFIQSRPCSSLDIYTVQDFIKWLREKQQAGA